MTLQKKRLYLEKKGTEIKPDFSQISHYLAEVCAINIEENIEQTIKTLMLNKKLK